MNTHATLVVGGSLAPAAVAVAKARRISLDLCKPYPTDDELIATANAMRAEALVIRLGRVSRAVLGGVPTLRTVVKHGVGTDGIDVAAAAERGIPVLIAGGANAQSVAEQALALLLGVARSTALLDRRLRDGHWDKATYAGTEIAGKSIGLVGLGAIGRAFLNLLAPFGVTARVYDPYLPTELIPVGVAHVGELADLLGVSDIVSLHCPLTAENRGLIGAEALARCKPGAILINTARGELIDEAALAAALANGTLAGAGLDTFAQEPPPADSILWSLDNLVASPHVGANTKEARARVGVRCIEQIADYLDHGILDSRNHVNAGLVAAA